jgi:1-acyl-sn-glycerol-3-phosphate acyltransferase
MSDIQRANKITTVKKANNLMFLFLRVVFTPFLSLLYNFKFDKKSTKDIKRPCLILSNHQTLPDQFFVTVGFKFGINFVASDSLFRHGLLSKLMAAIARPIPFNKGSSDMSAIRNMMSVIREGGCVGMFPSGNRSFFGDECTIVPGIGKLAKKLKADLVLVQIRGGYNTKPRWGITVNRGKLTVGVTRVVKVDEMTELSGEEIEKIIRDEICFNEYDWNKDAKIEYRGKRKAEYLESALFYCPSCSSMESLASKGNIFFCRNCGAQVEMNKTGFFEKSEQWKNLPDTILEWSHQQLSYIKQFDFSGFTDKPVFFDDDVVLLKAQRTRSETLLGKGRIELYSDRFIICGQTFYLAETTMAIQGIRKGLIYGKDGIYTLNVPKRTNLVKYMVCGYHLRNMMLGVKEEFYGY